MGCLSSREDLQFFFFEIYLFCLVVGLLVDEHEKELVSFLRKMQTRKGQRVSIRKSSSPHPALLGSFGIWNYWSITAIQTKKKGAGAVG